MARKKLITMSVVKQVIRMYMNGIPYRDIAEAVTINKETVVNYIKRAKVSGKDLNQLLAMEDSVLEALHRGGKAAYPDDHSLPPCRQAIYIEWYQLSNIIIKKIGKMGKLFKHQIIKNRKNNIFISFSNRFFYICNMILSTLEIYFALAMS